MQTAFRRALLALVCSLVVVSGWAAALSSGTSTSSSEAFSRFVEAYGRTPLAFEPNRGQGPASTRFIAAGHGYRIHLAAGATILAWSRKGATPHAISMRLVGARDDAEFVPERRLPSLSHYLVGEASKHLTDIPNYAAVRRNEIYPGIDLVYYGNPQRLEYDLIVQPGGQPERVRLAFEGVDRLELSDGGDLILHSGEGRVVQQRPHVYQEIRGKRREVAARYEIEDDQVAFRIAAYDLTQPLVIDPVIAYGSYEGGLSESHGIAVDVAGNAYIAGEVTQSSATFPLVNAYDARISRGDTDAYVQKFNAAGTTLIYSTYVGGGTGIDRATGIAIDSAGNAYVAGTTTSSDFPVTATPYQAPAATGGSFVFKLAPQGNALVYSTYLLNANARGIALDSGGNAYVTGNAYPAFVTTPGALQPTSHNTSDNPFVLKLNEAGSGVVYSTFLGGSSTDTAYGIALDASGNAYVAGSSYSVDFPTTANAYRPSSSGGREAFVAKINTGGTALVYSTYLGGTQADYATAIAVDTRGSAYVTGNTASFDFPVLGAFQPVKGGVGIQGTIDNAFVTKLSPGGNDLEYSSFLGGNGCIGPGSSGCLFSPPIDIGMSIAVDPGGNAYVGGQTQSITFPRVDSLQGAVASNGDAAFVVKVSKLGGVLVYSTLVGGTTGIGNPTDWVTSMAADGSGNVYGTGSITDFPTTAGPYQSGGGSVVFRMSSGSATLNVATSANPSLRGQTTTLTASMSDPALTGSVLFVVGTTTIASAALVNGVASTSYAFPAGIHGLTAIYRNAAATIEIESPLVYQITNPAAVCN